MHRTVKSRPLSLGISFMPHSGHLPSAALITSGCIGHVKTTAAAFGISFIPHFGHDPSSVLTTSACIGHVKTTFLRRLEVHLGHEGDRLVRLGLPVRLDPLALGYELRVRAQRLERLRRLWIERLPPTAIEARM